MRLRTLGVFFVVENASIKKNYICVRSILKIQVCYFPFSIYILPERHRHVKCEGCS